MATQQILPSSDDRDISSRGETFSRADIIAQVDKIIENIHFRNSKRYPSFLRFIVEQTLAGGTHFLKERNIGTDVFGKPSDYDTNADPIVRVTAGEVRKRIAQYYQEPGHEEEIRVYLPVGSYVPQFLHPKHAPPFTEHFIAAETEMAAAFPKEVLSTDPIALFPEASPSASTSWHLPWRSLLIATIAVITMACAGLLLVRYREKQPVRSFWSPILSTEQPVLIVLGVHALGPQGDIASDRAAASSNSDGPQVMLDSMTGWDMVPISDIASYSKLTDLLTRGSRGYRLKGSAETSLEELREGPVILIGGLDNIWTMRLSSALRFSFSRNGRLSSSIRDREQPTKELIYNNMQVIRTVSRDYAIVANYFDPTIRQHVLIAAGIGKSGTQAAAEFVTSNDELKAWLGAKGLPPNKNFEVVLATDTINGEPGPPSVIASTFW